LRVKREKPVENRIVGFRERKREKSMHKNISERCVLGFFEKREIWILDTAVGQFNFRDGVV